MSWIWNLRFAWDYFILLVCLFIGKSKKILFDITDKNRCKNETDTRYFNIGYRYFGTPLTLTLLTFSIIDTYSSGIEPVSVSILYIEMSEKGKWKKKIQKFETEYGIDGSLKNELLVILKSWYLGIVVLTSYRYQYHD